MKNSTLFSLLLIGAFLIGMNAIQAQTYNNFLEPDRYLAPAINEYPVGYNEPGPNPNLPAIENTGTGLVADPYYPGTKEDIEIEEALYLEVLAFTPIPGITQLTGDADADFDAYLQYMNNLEMNNPVYYDLISIIEDELWEYLTLMDFVPSENVETDAPIIEDARLIREVVEDYLVTITSLEPAFRDEIMKIFIDDYNLNN